MRAQHPRAKVRAARRKNRWSYGDLARELSQRDVRVGRSYLSAIEKGEREPNSLELVVAFELVLGVPAEEWPNFTALTRFLELRGVA